MRTSINAIINVVVNDRLDRTNVAGIDTHRGYGLLRSRFYATCAPLAHAQLPGIKQQMPAQACALLVESRGSSMVSAPCWRLERPFTGTLAFACTT